MTEPSTLAALLSWYRSEWIAETPSRVHVRDIDAGGAPEWHQRFRSLVNGDVRSFPLRHQLRAMSKRGTRSHRRARFLFVLACRGFDPVAAAAICYPETCYVPGWVERHTQRCLFDLYRMSTDPERTHEDGRPRTFVERRIGKSEAQAMAEVA